MKRLQSPYDLVAPFFIIVAVVALAIWLGGCTPKLSPPPSTPRSKRGQELSPYYPYTPPKSHHKP